MVTTITLLYFHRTNLYGHYAGIAYPYFCMAAIESRRLYRQAAPRCRRWVMRAVCLFFALEVGWAAVRIVRYWGDSTAANTEVRVCARFLELIPPEERNSVVGYNTWSDFYRVLDLRPACRFFCNQDWAAINSKSLQRMLREELTASKPVWVIQCYSESRPYGMCQSLLDSYYTPVEEDLLRGYVLYRRVR